MNEPMMAGSQHKTEASSLGASSNSHHISRIKSKPCFGRGKQCAPLLAILTLGWQLSTGLNGQHISIDQNLSENAASLVLGLHEIKAAPLRRAIGKPILGGLWSRVAKMAKKDHVKTTYRISPCFHSVLSILSIRKVQALRYPSCVGFESHAGRTSPVPHRPVDALGFPWLQ